MPTIFNISDSSVEDQRVGKGTYHKIQSTVSMVNKKMSELLVNPKANADPDVSNSLSFLYSQLSELESVIISPYEKNDYNGSSIESTPDSSPISNFTSEALVRLSYHSDDSDSTRSTDYLMDPPSILGKRKKQRETKTKTIIALQAFSNICSKQGFIENSREVKEGKLDLSTLPILEPSPTPPLPRTPGLFNSEFKTKVRRTRAKQCPSTSTLQCRSCGETKTCEWRRGPDGYKSLCNACGIHFAKIVKREEVNSVNYIPKSEVKLKDILNN